MGLKRNFNIVGWLVLVLAVLLGAGCSSKQVVRDDPYSVTVLHTNDVHGGYGGLTKDGRSCYAPYCEEGRGGSVRLQQAVQAVRQSVPNVVLLDAGDEFQGTLYSTIFKEELPPIIMDKVGYDAFVPGNHEFDYGCETFFAFVRSLNIPVLAANLVVSVPGEESLQPWVILERNGRRIGVIGLATTETPEVSSPCPELEFTDEATALRRAVAELEGQGVNIIIALTHIGYERDRKLGQTVSGVDIIVGGHSHTLLSSVQDRAVGPYPAVEKNPDGEPVLVVSAGNGCSFLGRLDVSFDARGVATLWTGEPIVLDEPSLAALNAPPPDPELARLVAEYSEPVQTMLHKKLGQIDVADKVGKSLENNVQECREGECLSGNLATDAMLRVAFPEAQVAVLNSGTLRNSLPGGDVTMGDVMACLPFQNTLVMAEVPGSILWAMLEHGVSRFGEGHGSFPMTAGARFSFDGSAKPGERLIQIEVKDVQGVWQEINLQAAYLVATTKFMADGGDGYGMLQNIAWIESPLLLSDAVRIDLEMHSPLAPQFGQRTVNTRKQ